MGAVSQLFFVPKLSAARIFGGWPTTHEASGESYPLYKSENVWYATHTLAIPAMNQKTDQQVVHVVGIIAGHLVDGTVSFSPAPQLGIFSELAKFAARRILTDMVEEEIRQGRI
jgi:hypothetical protein